MVWAIVARTLALAASAAWKAARSPAVRKAAIEAAKKAESSFGRFTSSATQACTKAWRVIRGRAINISPRTLQKKFKHARDFGVNGNYNPTNATKFQEAIQRHVADKGTKVIQGTYRGDPVRHFVNPTTGLNVVKDASGNFVSGWKLSVEQLKNVISHGKLGGG